VEPLNGFDEELTLLEDVDFYGRAIYRFGAYFTDRVTLHYRVGPSLMHRPDVDGEVRAASQRMHAKFRRDHSGGELKLMKLFSKMVAVAAH
jgi:hypothetical protein